MKPHPILSSPLVPRLSTPHTLLPSAGTSPDRAPICHDARQRRRCGAACTQGGAAPVRPVVFSFISFCQPTAIRSSGRARGTWKRPAGRHSWPPRRPVFTEVFFLVGTAAQLAVCCPGAGPFAGGRAGWRGKKKHAAAADPPVSPSHPTVTGSLGRRCVCRSPGRSSEEG